MGGSSSQTQTSELNPAAGLKAANDQAAALPAYATRAAALMWAETQGDKFAEYKGRDPSDINMLPLVAAYLEYQRGGGADNTQQKDEFNKYALLANSQQGRDATILTGPAQSPNLLGGR